MKGKETSLYHLNTSFCILNVIGKGSFNWLWIHGSSFLNLFLSCGGELDEIHSFHGF